MGRQIQIAQSAVDERDLQIFLAKKWKLLCLPRVGSSPVPEPIPFGNCDSMDQIIFPAALSAFVVSGWQRLKPAEWRGETEAGNLGHMSSTRFLASVEWRRTDRVGEHYVTGGRFYLHTPGRHPQPSPEQKLAVQQLFNAIVSKVQRSYPMRSFNRYPTYVGPDLARQIGEGHATLKFAGGEVVETVPNERAG